MLVVAPLMGTLALVVTAQRPPTFRWQNDPATYILAGTLAALCLAYALTRAGRYRLAAHLAVAAAVVAVFLAALPEPGETMPDLFLLNFLVIPVLFARMILSFRAALAWAGGTWAGMFLYRLLVPLPGAQWAGFPEVVAFVSLGLALILLSARHRAWVEAARRADLEEREARYRNLLEAGFGGIAICEQASGTILQASTNFARLFGREQVVGMAISDLLSPGIGDLVGCAPETCEATGHRGDGSTFPAHVLVRSDTYRGQPVHLLAVRDISQRKAAEETLRQRVERSAHLLERARDLGASLELEEVLARVAQAAKSLLHARGCAIFLLSEDGTALRPTVVLNPPYEEQFRNALIPVEGSLNGQAVKARRTLVFNREGEKQQGYLVPGTPRLSTERVLVAPLIADGQVLGTIWLNRVDADFTEDDRVLAETFAAYASTALRNAQTYDALQREMAERRRAEETLRLLYEAGREFASTLDPEVIWDVLYRTLSRRMDCDGLFITAFSQEDNLIRCVAVRAEGGKRADVSGYPPIPLEPEGHGIQSEVIRTGQPLLISDYEAHLRKTLTVHWVDGEGRLKEEPPNEDTPRTRSALVVPMKFKGQVVGVVQVFSYRPNAYTGEDLRFAEALAQHAAAAYNNALLYSQAQAEIAERRRAQALQRVLLEIAEAVHRTEDLDALYRAIHRALGSVMNVEHFYITLYDQEKDTLTIPYASQGRDHFGRARPERTISAYVIRTGKPLLARREDLDRLVAAGEIENAGRGAKVWLGAPLLVEEKILGVIAVESLTDEDAFDEEDLTILEYVSGQVALAIARKRTQEALAESERTLSTLMSNLPGMVYRCWNAPEWPMLFVSEGCQDLTGYPSEDLMVGGKVSYAQLIHPDDRQRVWEEIQTALERQEPFRLLYRIVTAEGEEKWVWEQGRGIFAEDGSLLFLEGFITDITAQVRAEEEARRRASYAEALNTIIAAGAAATDARELLQAALDRTLEALNLDAGAAWLGGQEIVLRNLPGPPEALRERIVRAFPEGDKVLTGPYAVEDWQERAREGPEPALARLLAGMGILASVAVPLLAEGEPVGGLWVVSSSPRRWRPEEVTLLQAVGRQVGAAVERLRLLARIQEQARLTQSILDAAPEGTFLLDEERRIALTNPAAQVLLRDLADAKEGEALAALGGESLERFLVPPPEGLPHHELALEGPPPRRFEVAAQPMEGGGWVLVLRDVTEEWEMRRRAQDQERLAAVGQLAAGIAHDFNNILTGIIGFAQLLLLRQDLPEDAHESLRTIFEQGERAAQLVRQILDFSRKSISQQRPMDLLPFLKEAVRLLERTLPETITLATQYRPGEYWVQGDVAQLQQVVTNLAVNARDAMPKGGTLRITLRRVEVDGEKPLPEMDPGSWIALSVSDTGVGIPPDVLPHIFEPFFTTKEPGTGTGLGLAQVYGIVKQHRGHIAVETEVGRGSTFTVYLPALPTGHAEAPGEGAQEVPRGNGELVLLVEDEEAVRRVGERILRRLGYEVLAAGSGEEALEVYRARRGEVAAVLTDWVMPGIHGEELLRALKEEDSEVRVVVMTGYPLMAKDQRTLLELGVAAWLQKPFAPADLARVLHRALHGPAA